MKSVKPGRAPSMMGAFASAAISIFGIIWTLLAVSMGAPILFACFGIIFVAIGIAQTVYNFKNATSKNRYSAFDITEGTEESDPLNEFFGGNRDSDESGAAESTANHSSDHSEMPGEPVIGGKAFCPYCGAEAEGDFLYCAKCGKKLPD